MTGGFGDGRVHGVSDGGGTASVARSQSARLRPAALSRKRDGASFDPGTKTCTMLPRSRLGREAAHVVHDAAHLRDGARLSR